MNFEIGDTVRIINNVTLHRFDMNEVIVVDEVNTDNYYRSGTRMCNAFSAEDCELVKKKKVRWQKGIFKKIVKQRLC